MHQKNKNKAFSSDLLEYISEELEYLDADFAKLTFYTLLLDKYAVPQDHALRKSPQHHLPVDQLSILLREKGFTPSKQIKTQIH